MAPGFLPLLLVNLYHREPGTLAVVIVIVAVVLVAELGYFERDFIEREIEQFERTVG